MTRHGAVLLPGDGLDLLIQSNALSIRFPKGDLRAVMVIEEKSND
ncbi:hypothetical protein GGD67_002859 [Bradyrhizobium sp. IAR9]|nr:hypothetical protein [Bradyrhizobium sp. IAR9]